MLIQDAVALQRSRIEPSLGKPVGASNEAIAELEHQLGLKLPLAYREFLLWMGADRAGILRGTDCFIESIASNGAALEDLFEENSLPLLASKPIVFFMHQGYIACWFKAETTEEDPQVHSFNEADPDRSVRNLGKFSTWLRSELEGLSNAPSFENGSS